MESIIARIRIFANIFFLPVLIVLLMVLSFFLGRITKFMESTPAFSFESAQAEELAFNKEKDSLFSPNSSVVSTSTIVASRGGKKYYFVWCKAVINIKDSKRVYFVTEDLAQKAGYTLANNCR